jgi:2-phosphoglycerate kinase
MSGDLRPGSKKERYIVISDEKHGLPYSKGLNASAIMATGLSPGKAYSIAKQIEDYLRSNDMFFVTRGELKSITYKTLSSQIDQEHAEKYLKWQSLAKLDKPLIILIGGTTGVGKSTIATEIAHRLGITRIVNTDSIREVMRALFSKELMPALYKSSFSVWKSLRAPLPDNVDPVIVGFQGQVSAVVVGVKAVIKRAIEEGTSMVLEGVHIVPGFIDSGYFENAFVVPLVITVRDEEIHRSHFHVREVETEGVRPFKKYRSNFGNIRKLGEYIESLSDKYSVSKISCYNLDVTVSLVLEEIIRKVLEREA